MRAGHSFGETCGNASIEPDLTLLGSSRPGLIGGGSDIHRVRCTHHAGFRRLREQSCLRSSRPAVEICDDLACVRKGRVSCGHAGVDCQLHQDLFQLVARKAALSQSSAGV